MIPSIARIAILRNGRESTYWIPLVLVWIILIPVLLLLGIPFLIGCLLIRVNPLPAAGISWEIARAVKGTEIDLTFHHSALSILVL